jgi:hypothetical protein
VDLFKLFAVVLVGVAAFVVVRTLGAPPGAAAIVAVASGAVAGVVLYLRDRVPSDDG